MKTTLATTASVEAQLPVQAQQILRQVSQGWISPRGIQNSPQPERKNENWALQEGKRHPKPPALISQSDVSSELAGVGLELRLGSAVPAPHAAFPLPRRSAASPGRSSGTLPSTSTGLGRR